MKQAINTRTQEEYDALMRYFESKGIKWMGGEDATLVKVWTYYSEKTCVYLSDLGLEWESIHYFELKDRIIIPYTEFAKANITPDYKALYLEGRELLEGSLSILKQTEAHRKATGLTLGNIFLESQIEQSEAFLTKHN